MGRKWHSSQVKPKRGRAVVFYNLMHDHESLVNPVVHEAFDHKALHNGCDVLDKTGVKVRTPFWLPLRAVAKPALPCAVGCQLLDLESAVRP